MAVDRTHDGLDRSPHRFERDVVVPEDVDQIDPLIGLAVTERTVMTDRAMTDPNAGPPSESRAHALQEHSVRGLRSGVHAEASEPATLVFRFRLALITEKSARCQTHLHQMIL